MSQTKFSGEFNAWNYAYGVNPDIPAFEVIAGNSAAGTYAVTLALGVVYTPDGKPVSPVVGIPITIGSGINAETVTPTGVSNPTPTVYGTCIITAVFGFGHGAGDLVKSGDFGLQEAATAALAYGGGLVVCDRRLWNAAGLTTNANFTTFVTAYKGLGLGVTILNWGGISGALSYTAASGSSYASTTLTLY
jgi:hypothetical protein